MTSVKLLFRHAAHSERTSESVSNSNNAGFFRISENEFSKKFVFRVGAGRIDAQRYSFLTDVLPSVSSRYAVPSISAR